MQAAQNVCSEGCIYIPVLGGISMHFYNGGGVLGHDNNEDTAYSNLVWLYGFRYTIRSDDARVQLSTRVS